MIQTLVRYKSLSINQLISDLNWIVKSESLIHRGLPEFEGDILNSLQDLIDVTAYENWLNQLKSAPQELEAFFRIADQLILGKYLERLLKFFFSAYPSFELIHAGKQIFEEQTTIGELDFVIKDKVTNKVHHIEVAVKYYMGFKDVGKHDLWIGPNGMDTLQKKIRKLDKQLTLSRKLDFNVDLTQAFIIGYFFRHWKSRNWPYFYEEREGEGQWLYVDEMSSYFSTDKLYSIIPKYRWLSFYIDETCSVKNGLEIQKEIDSQVNEIAKGIMVAEVDTSNKVLNKCIVAPLKWPKL